MTPYPLAWPENIPRWKGSRQPGQFKTTLHGAMTNVSALGRFGHHPDPAIDFEVEIQDLEAEVYNFNANFQPLPRETIERRIERAMGFRVGGVPSCVTAKDALRTLEQQFRAAVSPDLPRRSVGER